MADYREGLYLIPEHMHRSVRDWIEHAEPHPRMLGSFFAAVLTDSLMGAACNADQENLHALLGWAHFLYNFAPSSCYGSKEKIDRWYEAHHEPAEAPLGDA